MISVHFISLSRSDYTSLRPVIKAALNDSELEVKIIAGGSHLLKRFGNSIESFKKDNIPIHHIINFLSESDDSDEDFAISFGKAYQGFTKYFIDQKPDRVFILGDRWEMLAASAAANILRIPIIHHSGGDITQGSLDNQTRYVLSIQSHLHLVALDEHRQRLILMGEEEWRITTVGEPALTELNNIASETNNIFDDLGIPDGKEFVLATFHPTTFDKLPAKEQIDLFIEILQEIKEEIILTAPNPDPNSKFFYNKLLEFTQANSHVHFFENLGYKRYYGAMKHAKFMIGNSSSGIWEAPSFSLPVINLGDRQKDRLRAGNVIDVDLNIKSIKLALEKVSDKANLKDIVNPYVKENTNQLILKSIKMDIGKSKLLSKKLNDPLQIQND
jgi:UDP-hydrolysing UDP-N-acetyl-D-glucosamine 2-epimerase